MNLSSIGLGRLLFIGMGLLVVRIAVRTSLPVVSEVLSWTSLLIIGYCVSVMYIRRKR